MTVKPYGWQGPKPSAVRTWSPLATRTRPSLGNNDPNQVKDFMQGIKEARDDKTKTGLMMLGAFVGVKAIQGSWSSWARKMGPHP